METNLGQGVPVKRWRKCWGEALKFCSWPHYLWRIIACSSVEKKLGALARWEVGQTRAVPTSCRVRNWWKNVVWPAGLECPLLYLLNAPSPQNRWITVKSCVLQTDFDFHSEWENTFYVVTQYVYSPVQMEESFTRQHAYCWGALYIFQPILFYAMPCHAMPCHAMPFYAVPFQSILFLLPPFPSSSSFLFFLFLLLPHPHTEGLTTFISWPINGFLP